MNPQDILAICLRRLQLLLNTAQTIRINQVQCCNEAGWPRALVDKCNKAWDEFNKQHEGLAAELAKLRVLLR